MSVETLPPRTEREPREEYAPTQDDMIGGPEKLMLWLFVTWFVLFALILLGGLLSSFID